MHPILLIFWQCIDESIRSQKEMSINGKQETVLFQLEVGRSGSSFLDFELLKHYHYPITSERLCCIVEFPLMSIIVCLYFNNLASKYKTTKYCRSVRK